MRDYNFILDTDGYKMSHSFQYPPGTTKVYSYIESRGGKYDEMLFVGIRPVIERLASVRITREQVDYAEEFCRDYGAPFDRTMWDIIAGEHGGKLPLRIRHVPEGTILPTRNVVVDVVNTDDRCSPLVSFIETMLLRAVWYPVTVASRELKIRRTLSEFLRETTDMTPSGVALALQHMHNDFGSRGVSSYESSEIGGFAHLCLFRGTDNTPAVKFCRDVYGEPMAGATIAAAEHSTVTSWGRSSEEACYANMVDQFAQRGIMAVVSDSYNIFKAADEIWGGSLLEKVRASGARVVVRPDSGDPTEVPIEVIETLMLKAGCSVNSKGFRVLPSYFRVIQGDGVNEDSIRVLLGKMRDRKISAENIVFGMGGAMLQQLDRDTMKFAMKCSAIERNGEWVDVYKDPITDPGKKSKKGRLDLVRTADSYITIEQGLDDADRIWLDEVLVDGFLNGECVSCSSLRAIRSRIDEHENDRLCREDPEYARALELEREV